LTSKNTNAFHIGAYFLKSKHNSGTIFVQISPNLPFL